MRPAKPQVRTAVIYARLSRSRDDSVSIARQIEACQEEATRRGWDVVGTFTDDGVSATKNRPSDRDGWKALIASPLDFQAVLIWKIDRLARRTIDFLSTNEAVEERGAVLVAVADQLDMSTPAGVAFASIGAVFAQVEADSMSARQIAARAYRIEHGIFPGGVLPYGFRAVPNPDGTGKIVAQDPDEAAVVRLVVERTLQGYTLYSTQQHLIEAGIPTRSDAFRERGIETTRGREWAYPTLDAMVRNPMIAGMRTKPGGYGKNTPAWKRELVRDEVGLPIVDESLAIIPLGQWYELQEILSEPSPRRMPVSMKRKTSALLSGLMFCGDPRHDEPVRMYRKTTARGTAAFSCPACRQQISSFEDLVLREFFEKADRAVRYVFPDMVEESSSREAAIREAAARVKALTEHYVASVGAEAEEALVNLQRAKADQEAALAMPAGGQLVEVPDWPESAEEEFGRATDDLQRQKVMRLFLDRIIVRRGPQGAKSDAAKLARLEWQWRPEVVFVDHSPMTDEEIDALAAWAERDSS